MWQSSGDGKQIYTDISRGREYKWMSITQKYKKLDRQLERGDR